MTDKVGQTHSALELHAVARLLTLAHRAEQICTEARSGHSVARYDEIEYAPVASPKAERQFTQAGPLAERVGHRHWALEQTVAATATLAHCTLQLT